MRLSDAQNNAKHQLYVAVDGLYGSAARELIHALSPFVGGFKINSLYDREGKDIIDFIKELGNDVFVDLKLHDIPNTVQQRAQVMRDYGVDFFTVHASGGRQMLEAALQGAQGGKSGHYANYALPQPLGVTVLTSIDTAILHNQLQIEGTAQERTLQLAHLCKETGIKYIVTSGEDLSMLTQQFDSAMHYIVPGLSVPGSSAGSDQKRVYGVKEAVRDGASYVVVGRAITAQPDKIHATKLVIDEIIAGRALSSSK